MKGWTLEEVNAFAIWDKKRKNGELGVPMHFNNADELMAWLKNEK